MADDVTARDVVDLALDDKPNKASEVMNNILLDKIGDQVQGMKDAISNDMFGQEMPEPEDVEVQPELDLEPNEDEEADDEYDGEVEETEPEESEEEEEEQ